MKATPVSMFMGVGRLIKSRLEKTLPCTLAQCEVLRIVEEEKNPTMREVAATFRIAAPSATALVEPLVKEGYVSRRTDSRDRRQVRLSLTAHGKREAVKIRRARARVIAELLGVLSRSEQEDLSRLLNAIITNASV